MVINHGDYSSFSIKYYIIKLFLDHLIHISFLIGNYFLTFVMLLKFSFQKFINKWLNIVSSYSLIKIVLFQFICMSLNKHKLGEFSLNKKITSYQNIWRVYHPIQSSFVFCTSKYLSLVELPRIECRIHHRRIKERDKIHQIQFMPYLRWTLLKNHFRL